MLNFTSNLCTYGHKLIAYERNARGANLHPGVNLHPGANLHRLQIVPMNTALSKVRKLLNMLLHVGFV